MIRFFCIFVAVYVFRSVLVIVECPNVLSYLRRSPNVCERVVVSEYRRRSPKSIATNPALPHLHTEYQHNGHTLVNVHLSLPWPVDIAISSKKNMRNFDLTQLLSTS